MNKSVKAREFIEAVLQVNPLLESLSPEIVRDIAKHSALTTISPGENLFEMGEPASAFYYLTQGRVKLYRLSPKGDEKIIEVIQPGNLFAFPLLFVEGSEYPVSATALLECEVICIDSQHFASVLAGSTALCFSVMAAMSRRMMGLIQEIDALSLQTGSSRFASYLLSHTSEKQPVYQLPVSKKNLASLLSIKPETLSRIMRCLISAGVIELHDKEVTILSREGLSVTICPLADYS